MYRSALLAAILLIVLAGCLGPTADTGPDSRTAEMTPTSSPYPNETVAFPDGPKERPALPETLTADTASEYARTHEFRYKYNGLWDGPDTQVGMSEASCTVESAEEHRDGYLVTVGCTAYVNKPDGDPNSTATVHYDYAPWTVEYYVDEDSVVRTEVE